MEIKKIAVLGAGNMGHGIARTCAVYGFEVSLSDQSEDILKKAKLTIEEEIAKHFVRKGKMTEAQAKEILGRLRYVADMEEAVADADLVIEAIFEDMDLKKRVFAKLDSLCPAHTILSSNTSHLSITGIASATKRPDRVIGLHFFNPPDVNPLLEVAPGLATSEGTVEKVMVVCKRMGKLPMRVKDTPSYVVNRFINAIYSEAARTVQNGIATAEQIDFGVKNGLGFRLGPCEMMDYSGLDLVAYGMSKVVSYADIYLLQKMVDAGRYGRKNGRGFYDYHDDGTKTLADLSNITGK
jgi:3-hydroxybutyryl-CoA dehydrogenase